MNCFVRLWLVSRHVLICLGKKKKSHKTVWVHFSIQVKCHSAPIPGGSGSWGRGRGGRGDLSLRRVKQLASGEGGIRTQVCSDFRGYISTARPTHSQSLSTTMLAATRVTGIGVSLGCLPFQESFSSEYRPDFSQRNGSHHKAGGPGSDEVTSSRSERFTDSQRCPERSTGAINSSSAAPKQHQSRAGQALLP